MLDDLADLAVDETSPVPVYYQVYEALRDKLSAAAPGSKLPTERTLAHALGISRATLRQALTRLERDGLLVRRQGNGTFVAEPRVEHDMRALRGFTSEFVARGKRVRSRVLELRTVPAPARLRSVLAVGPERDALIELRRVRSLDGVPMSIETVWLSRQRCAALLDRDLDNGSLYAALHDIGVVPVTGHETLTATVLDDYEAVHLEQHPGAPAMLIERTTYDADGDCVEVVRTLLRADRFQIRTTLDLVAPDARAPGDRAPRETAAT